MCAKSSPRNTKWDHTNTKQICNTKRQQEYKPVTSDYAELIQGKVRDLHTNCYECMGRVKQHSAETMEKHKMLDPRHKDIIIDFTAQHGEFIESACNLVKIPLFYDKEPLHPDVKQLNFLNLDFDKFNKTFLFWW